MNPELSFDGYGINGPDEYRTRLATFRERSDESRKYGPLFAAAPDMERALVRVADRLEAWAEAHERIATNTPDGPEYESHANRAANYRELVRIARESLSQ